MGDVHATVVGARAAADRFGRIRARLPGLVDRAPNEVAAATGKAYEAVAPRKTGRLVSRIHAEGNELIVDPVSDTGFHYAPVTRFGRGPIVAKHLSDSGRPGALRFQIGGQTIYRRSVGPYVPAGDWAQRAHPEADRIAQERFNRIVEEALG